MDDAAREALRERIAKMTPEQLERAREQAREQQWDDEWWRQYQKTESNKREKERERLAESEKKLVAQYNLTLTESSAKALAHPDGGFVFVTWANAHYTDFALSWVEHLRGCGLGDHLVIGAMDDPVLYSLAKRRIPAFAMQSGKRFFFGFGGRRGTAALAGPRSKRARARGAIFLSLILSRARAHKQHHHQNHNKTPTTSTSKQKASPRATLAGAARPSPRWAA